MKKWLLSAIAFSFLGLSYAEVQVIGPFTGGLNNTDEPFAIQEGQASDLLNVEVSLGGKSVKKRKGYGTAFTLSNATSPVHGIYNFYDTDGSDVSLFFNDRNIERSVSGATPSVIWSTATNGATYQCIDAEGFAYCANTSRDGIFKVDASAISLLSGFTSTGTMVTVTPERLVQAGFSDFPNRIDFSKPNDFNTWTPASTNADPIRFTITAPGSGIKHITYAHGRVYWFKDSSFGYIQEGPTSSQLTLGDGWEVRTLNQFIGALSNTSIFRNDILYFQGQDSHFYGWDGTNLQKLSRDIQGTIDVTQGTSIASWEQTTQADFEQGVSSSDITTSQFPDYITAKTTSYLLSAPSQFSSSGSSQYIDTGTWVGGLRTVWPDEFDQFRDGTSGTFAAWAKTPNMTASVSGGTITLSCDPGCGSDRAIVSISSSHAFGAGATFYLQIHNIGTFTTDTPVLAFNTSYFTLDTDVYTGNGHGGSGQYWAMFFQLQGTNSPYARILDLENRTDGGGLTVPSGYYPFPLDISFYLTSSNYTLTINTVSVTGSHTFPNKPLHSYLIPYGSLGNRPFRVSRYSIAPQTFTITTSVLDSGIVIPKWSTFTIQTSNFQGSLPTHTTQASSDGISFDSAVSITTGSTVSSLPKRYLKIASLYSNNTATNTAIALSTPVYNVSAGSSGTYLSAVHNAPNISGWDSFNVNGSEQDGRITWYTRSATATFNLLTSTLPWTLTPANSIPTISTFPFFQARADFVSNSSGSVQVNDFTFNWFEGLASDKVYSVYHDNANWWSVASGTGASANNKILRHDLLNGGWYVYEIPMNGMFVRNQRLYFGSSLAGVIYRFGDSENDNGSAINAYWKTRDYFGTSPFVDKDFWNLSMVGKGVSGSSMTVTYNINASTNTSSFSVPWHSGQDGVVKRNINLPNGTAGNTINFQFGNNAADQPFELFGGQFEFTERQWVPDDN